MLTYQETANWHSAPTYWESFFRATRSTSGSTRQVSVGAATGGTSRQSTSAVTEEGNFSRSSTVSQVASAGSSGTTTGSGETNRFTERTWDDTSSSTTSNGGSASATTSSATSNTGTSTVSVDLGVYHESTTSSSESRTITWPSTITAETTTGTEPATGTTTTRYPVTAASESKTATYITVAPPTTGDQLTSADTQVTTATSSTSYQPHAFAPLPHTLVHPDANGSPIFNDVVVWEPLEKSYDSTVGLFTDFFETLVKGTSSAVHQSYSRIDHRSTSWLSLALSTATETSTRSSTTGTTGTTSSTGTTVPTITVLSSLNGLSWNSTEDPSTTTLWAGGITGESTQTVPGPATITEYTYTSQVTGLTDSSQFYTSAEIASWGGLVKLSLEWNTWERSYTTTSSYPYPVSTSTKFLVPSYSTNGWFIGFVSSTSQQWQELTSSISFTSHDDRTNAVLIGQFSDTGASGTTSTASTVDTTAQTVTQTWGLTEHFERRAFPRITQQSASEWGREFSRSPRVWQSVLPRGFFGFGGGFGAGSPVYAGLTSALVSGDNNPAFSLVASNLPRAGMLEGASVFVTTPCWLDGHPVSSMFTARWLGTETGTRTSASLSHAWTTTATTIGASTATTVTKSATYSVAMTGSISGSYLSEYAPTVQHSNTGFGRPVSFSYAGGAMGGIAPVTISAQSVTFPPGALTFWWETSPGGGTTSSSASTSTGELTTTLQRHALAWSFEDALRYDWQTDIFSTAQLETASVYRLAAFPAGYDP